MVGLKILPKLSREVIRTLLGGKLDGLKKYFIDRFEYIGEEFIAQARTRANFTDQTANLRSSIGYVILVDGKQYKSAFPVHTGKDGQTGEEGARRGLELGLSFGKKYPSGIVLICVAGMEYAAAVESKNKDVITGSIPEVRELLFEAVQKINEEIGKL